MGKKYLNMLIKWVKMDKNLGQFKKNMNFQACPYKSVNFAQSQPHFAPLHNGQTVMYRHFANILY